MTDETIPPKEPAKDPLLFKLENEVDETSWEDLKNHYERGALVFISPVLDLIEVASKIIIDDVEAIKGWTESKQVYNPKDIGVEVDKDVKYKFIITQPFVLIQPITEKSSKED